MTPPTKMAIAVKPDCLLKVSVRTRKTRLSCMVVAS
jgi:hypothetical protein